MNEKTEQFAYLTNYRLQLIDKLENEIAKHNWEDAKHTLNKIIEIENEIDLIIKNK